MHNALTPRFLNTARRWWFVAEKLVGLEVRDCLSCGNAPYGRLSKLKCYPGWPWPIASSSRRRRPAPASTFSSLHPHGLAENSGFGCSLQRVFWLPSPALRRHVRALLGRHKAAAHPRGQPLQNFVYTRFHQRRDFTRFLLISHHKFSKICLFYYFFDNF